ncbi:galactose mutarotase-like protein, partial [Macrolepiota fuliginosa MF-IS2]
PFNLTEINAPDGSISVKFVSLGATLTELWVKDKNGQARDVALGYDDNSKLLTDPDHPVFNPVVGRYANHIKNGTFSIPITKDAQAAGPGVYQVPTNDHNSEVTLHSGPYDWDCRNFILFSHTPSSATHKFVDDLGGGFPGSVVTYVTHAASNSGVFKTGIRAYATEQTPIMLTQHVYWNLDAFQDNVNDIPDHHLQLDALPPPPLEGEFVPLTGVLLLLKGILSTSFGLMLAISNARN